MEKTNNLKKSIHSIGNPTRPKKDRPVIQFGTLAQMKEMMSEAIFPAEMRSKFPPDCGLKFSDDIVKNEVAEKTP